MENKKPDQTMPIVVDSVYTIAQQEGSPDKNVYLYKDKVICMCPYMSSVGMDWETKKHGLLPFSCGSFCQHFHIKRDMKKTSVEPTEGADKKELVEKLIPTGKIKVGLSCGSSGVWFDVAGLIVPDQKVPASNPSESSIKVVKTVEGEAGK